MKRAHSLLILPFLAGCISLNTDREIFEDKQVAMVMRVANLSAVREGALAREKAAEPSVREFATMMVNEHSSANSAMESELMKADIVSEDTELSRRLDAESGAATEGLRTLAGHAFDRAYIDRQIKVHQNLLSLIDTKLVPSSKKKVVKDQLTALRTAVQHHLTKAQDVLKTLP